MKIAMFEMENWELEALASLPREHDLESTEERLTEENAGRFADAEIISTFVYSAITRQVLEQYKQLKMIATRSTGFDHIDMDCCRERGIAVCNIPSYGENTVAEQVFALLLALSRRMVPAIDRTRRGDFSNDGLRGFDLMDKTMGVIGTGRIGLHTIRIARGFGMKVLAFDVEPRPEIARELDFRYVALEDLLAQVDVISLHVPENPATRHLLSAEEFDRMKDGVVLINTSRGGVVDHAALLQALHRGKVAAAGLDVLPEEPVIREETELLRSVFCREHDLQTLLADHILLRLRNVVITPHNAFNTREALQRILDTTRRNIEAFAEGDPQNLVT